MIDAVDELVNASSTSLTSDSHERDRDAAVPVPVDLAGGAGVDRRL